MINSTNERGSIRRQREAAHERRIAAENGSPEARNALRVPYRGSMDFLDRFFARCRRDGDCLVWIGHRDSRADQGYGVITIGAKPFRAHRIAWEIEAGRELSSDEYLCHRCDNPPCCEPDHLFVGDAAANNRDTVSKGRHAKAKRTHCLRGHAYEGKNVVANKDGGRLCRQCKYEQAARGRLARRDRAALPESPDR